MCLQFHSIFLNILGTPLAATVSVHYLLRKNMVLPGNSYVIIMTPETKMHRIAPFKTCFQPPNPQQFNVSQHLQFSLKLCPLF